MKSGHYSYKCQTAGRLPKNAKFDLFGTTKCQLATLWYSPKLRSQRSFLGPVCDIWQNYIRNSYTVTQKCSTREKNAQNADIHGFREFMFFFGGPGNELGGPESLTVPSPWKLYFNLWIRLEYCLSCFMLYRATYLAHTVSVFILTKPSQDLPRFPTHSNRPVRLPYIGCRRCFRQWTESHAACVSLYMRSSPSKPTSLPAIHYRSNTRIPLALRGRIPLPAVMGKSQIKYRCLITHVWPNRCKSFRQGPNSQTILWQS